MSIYDDFRLQTRKLRIFPIHLPRSGGFLSQNPNSQSLLNNKVGTLDLQWCSFYLQIECVRLPIHKNFRRPSHHSLHAQHRSISDSFIFTSRFSRSITHALSRLPCRHSLCVVVRRAHVLLRSSYDSFALSPIRIGR